MRGVHITLRMRLFCEIFRDGKPIEGQQYEVLNEVVVDRGANPYLTKIECYEQGRLITKASCPTAVIFAVNPVCIPATGNFSLVQVVPKTLWLRSLHISRHYCTLAMNLVR